MLDTVSTGTFLKWTLFGVAVVVVFGFLAPRMAGLIPVLFVLAFLIVFHPPKDLLTDADLDALLGRV